MKATVLEYLRTLSLKCQKARTKSEVVLTLPCWLSQFSILVRAFWHFKHRVLKYSKNCSLHNTLIPNFVKPPNVHSYISVRMPNVSVSASWWLYDEVITMRYLSSRRLTLSVICPLLARRLGVLEICRPNFSGCGLLVWFLMGSRIVLMEVRTSIHSLYIYSFCHFCLNTRYHVCTATCLSTLLTIYTYRSTYYKLCRPCKTNKVIYSSMHALDM